MSQLVDDDDPEEERALEDELRRRLEEYRSGAVKPIPSSEVFAKARAMLADRPRDKG
jgi:Putative addiction module component